MIYMPRCGESFADAFNRLRHLAHQCGEAEMVFNDYRITIVDENDRRRRDRGREMADEDYGEIEEEVKDGV